MAHIFDGKTYASRKEDYLREKVNNLKSLNHAPKLVSLLVGDDPASNLYVNLKKNAAERVGAEVEIYKFNGNVVPHDIIEKIEGFNEDKSVNGIMLQLPLPKNYTASYRDKIINTISEAKDVDGLRVNSKFITPTVKAVLEVLKEASPYVTFKEDVVKVAVVGAKGFEGTKIYSALREMDYEVFGLDKNTKNLKEITKNAEIVISVTGSRGIIGKNDIKKGAVVIDVGSPKGDVVTDEVTGKASFLSPVPGGVGPVTVVCLLENLIDAYESSIPN